jgi:HK97 family phage prohead protease
MSPSNEFRVFALRDAQVQGRTMTGLAAPYNKPTPINGAFVETLAPGVFKKSIQEAARGLPLLAFHDSGTYPVGKSVEWRETEEGLEGTWEFAKDSEATRAYEAAKEGFVGGLSVGFMPIINEVDPGTDTKPPHVVRKEARLLEVSLVSTPAYPDAQITLVRSAGIKVARPNIDRWREWADQNLEV